MMKDKLNKLYQKINKILFHYQSNLKIMIFYLTQMNIAKVKKCLTIILKMIVFCGKTIYSNKLKIFKIKSRNFILIN